MKNAELMGHIIAGYPNQSKSLQAGLGIIQGGAKFLEIQFPFSDPSADGPIIENACNQSIQNGFKIKYGFDLVEQLSPYAEILIMTYANIIFCYGIENFILEAKKRGAKGIIVPDLPIHQDDNLRKIAKKHAIYAIELITPNMTKQRLQEITKPSNAPFIYMIARSGITGDKTAIDTQLIQYIKKVKQYCDKKIALGFGIQSYEQVKAIETEVDIIVAGSYFVQKINKSSTLDSLKNHTKKLLGRSLT